MANMSSCQKAARIAVKTGFDKYDLAKSADVPKFGLGMKESGKSA